MPLSQICPSDGPACYYGYKSHSRIRTTVMYFCLAENSYKFYIFLPSFKLCDKRNKNHNSNNYNWNEALLIIFICAINWYLVDKKQYTHNLLINWGCSSGVWTQPNPKYTEYEFLNFFEMFWLFKRHGLKYVKLYVFGSQENKDSWGLRRSKKERKNDGPKFKKCSKSHKSQGFPQLHSNRRSQNPQKRI